MPELPEVETMVAYLRERGIAGTVTDVRVLRDPGGRYAQAKGMVGRELQTIARRGKYMTFHLDKGIAVTHNAMSGYWDVKGDEWCFDYVEGARSSKDSDVRMEFDVDREGTKKTVRFHDARLFGSFRYYQPCRSIEDIGTFPPLGPEAICTENADPTMDRSKRNWNILDAAMMLHRGWEVKRALMDQHAVAGFGNIYAAEACWRARLDPFRKTETLTTDEWQAIFESGQAVLWDALARKLNYSDLRAYRQKQCRSCEGPITKEKLDGRSTYFCRNCQK